MVSTIVLCVSLVILLCVISEKFSYKFGVPSLILFIFIGMVFGTDVVGIEYDNYVTTEIICSIGLIFIMFDGGFNTNWNNAKKTIKKSVSLSTIGVLLTAAISTVCCHYLLKLTFKESFLISSVLASTDAASVFAILKTNNLDLKDGTSSILEVESGSNDPMAYLLTITAVGLMVSNRSNNIIVTILLQVGLGLFLGGLFAYVSKKILKRKNILTDGLDIIFVFGIVLLCYAISDKLGGNAYLSVYICGLYLGNSRIQGRKAIADFFDQVTSFIQIMIFFCIGLLSVPHTLPASLPLALGVLGILTIIARPLMTILVLIPQGCTFRQCLLISWAGLRGASSIVFAIVAASSGAVLSFDIFNVVLITSLLSISLQGSLLPLVAKKLDMIDDSPNIYKTFNDFSDSIDFQFTRFHVQEDDPWVGKHIRDINLPLSAQIIMVKHEGKSFAARGDTMVCVGDDIIFNIPPFYPAAKEKVREVDVIRNHPWTNKMIMDLNMPNTELVICIVRDDQKIIPKGHTVIKEGDIILIFEGESNT